MRLTPEQVAEEMKRSINLNVSVRCPYCGLENIVPVDIDGCFIPKKIVTCDIDMGGCDRDFVIDPENKSHRRRV